MSSSCRPIFLMSVVVVVIIAGASCLTHAADLAVTRYDDPAPNGCQPGDCSLREALMAANATTDGDRILLSQGLYTLTLAGADEDAAATGDLDILEDVEIVGTSALTTIVRQNMGDRVFDIRNSTTQATLSKLTVTGGNADSGAGVRISRATVVIEDCEVFSNAGQVSSAPAVGVYLFADVTLRRTAVVGENGRAVQYVQATGRMENATLVASAGDALNLANGTVFECQHCTIVGEGPGAHVTVGGQATIATFINTVIDSDCFLNDSPTVVSLGGNFETPGDSCGFSDPSDLVNEPSAILQPLGNWGGATRTRLPDEGSPLIDSGQNGLCLAEDQTGFPRPYDGDNNLSADCDRGAAEAGGPRPGVPIFLDGFQSGGSGTWSAVVGG